MLETLQFVLNAIKLRYATQSPEAVAQRQQQHLRRLVHLTVEHSPFYREKYRGIDLERFQLTQLPPTNKDELMAQFDRAVTDPGVRQADVERFIADPANLGRYFQGRYALSHTSGTQGRPLLIVQDRSAVDLFFALQAARGNAFADVSLLGGVRRLLNPARLAVVTMRPGFFPSASAFAYMPRTARYFMTLLRLSVSDPDLTDRLNDFAPHVLIAYAGVLETLALESDRLRLAPHLRQLVNNSEKLTERARARVEEAFGVPVLDNYASGECPFLSTGCPAGPGAHVNADWAILEVVDDENRPVPPGQYGRKVLITNLANTVQPFIRYEIGDRLMMAADPCACGSRLPLIGSVEGRVKDDFWVSDGAGYARVIGSVFKNACDYLRGVREWQAVQRDRDHIEVRVEPLPDAGPDAEGIRGTLTERLEFFGLPGHVRVDVAVVPRLAPDAKTGKFLRLVSLGPPPGQAEAAEPAVAQGSNA
jgi:phenylacetate-CoA ligase